MKESHSKMKNVQHNSLQLQDYFKDPQLSVENKRDIFSARTRMADFGENFKGPRTFVVCPFLCNQRDSQSHSFTCSGVTQKIEIKGSYKDIFEMSIPATTGYTLTKIKRMRSIFLEEHNISVFPGERRPNLKRKKS